MDNPHDRGKALTANKRGSRRWRVGDCRIVADIVEDTVGIVVVDIGHRSTVYDF
ncbi:type II toxin-antitoxin system RelE/ParE family toxin [Corynebacterium sp. ES2715-CONJ3]|uniref:type II toxin-antitoxin system RelE family toxin n=1 Tax=Corynebacterium sp. ES2715-CONJ3 TaxID=2974028 RepID=UPI002169E8CD|nr:type II toxin-antitoxin system RelE/ParE family toxin [Corynebacterium sp. ES2715-CONJ3]